MNKVNPTIMMFLELADWVYCKVDRPRATLRAQVKHRTEAANASGIEAISAPIFPVEEELRHWMMKAEHIRGIK